MAIEVRYDSNPGARLEYARRAGEAQAAAEALTKARQMALQEWQTAANIDQNQQGLALQAATANANREQRAMEFQSEQANLAGRYQFEANQQDKRLAAEAEMYRARGERDAEMQRAAQEAADAKQAEHDHRAMVDDGIQSGKLYYTKETEGAINAIANDYTRLMADPKLSDEEKRIEGAKLYKKRNDLIYNGAIPVPPKQKPPTVVESMFPGMSPEDIAKDGWEVKGNYVINKPLGIYGAFDPSTGKTTTHDLPKPDKPDKEPVPLTVKFQSDELYRNRVINTVTHRLIAERKAAAAAGDGDWEPPTQAEIEQEAMYEIGAAVRPIESKPKKSPALPAQAAAPSPAPAPVAGQGGIAQPKSKAEYDALPKGATYLHPDGSVKEKK